MRIIKIFKVSPIVTIILFNDNLPVSDMMATNHTKSEHTRRKQKEANRKRANKTAKVK